MSTFKKLKFSFESTPVGSKMGRDIFCQQQCGSFMAKAPGCMLKLSQKVGEMVHVPPGWLRAVFTQQPSVKIVWDIMVPESLPNYAAAWAHVGTFLRHTSSNYVASF